jgi:hypothetical protein
LTDEQQIQEIAAWFEERGYELFWHEHAGAWRAPFIPKGHRIGSADFGSGATALDAARDAQRIFEQANPPKAYGIGLAATVETAGAITPLPGALLLGADDATVRVGESDAARLTEVDEKIAAERLGFGWRIWFEPEPDGTYTAVAGDHDTGEVLRTSKGDSFEDAYLQLGIDLRPPSDEVRREQQERRDSSA